MSAISQKNDGFTQPRSKKKTQVNKKKKCDNINLSGKHGTYTQKKKTLTGSYKTIGNEIQKTVPSKTNIIDRNGIDKELYKKLKMQTLKYKNNLKRGKKITLILRTCPEIMEEALSIVDLQAYKLYLNNSSSKDMRSGNKSEIDRKENKSPQMEVEDTKTNDLPSEIKSDTTEEDGDK